MSKRLVKFSIRMDNNLKTRIELLAKKNNLNFTKTLNYIAELGYQSYIKRFDNYYEEQNKLLERNKDFYE
ncbi:MAG TPA: hypothetical protein DHV70_00190 [Firmicutes bacterium]|nr:hypothetical protein [Bacillota bacterium]